MLKFKSDWRFDSPGAVPNGALSGILDLIGKISTQGDRQEILEHFKTYFARATGATTTWSSSESWAETDLDNYMSQAGQNGALFVEAFYDACEALRKRNPELAVPSTNQINRVLRDTSSGWQIQPPYLIASDGEPHAVVIENRPVSVGEKAIELIQASLTKSEQLLAAGDYKQSVQEIVWLLETVTTAFQGLETEQGTIQGKYFNKIVGDLRRHHKGQTFDQVLSWMMELHGYLSAPTGGQIRHGAHLSGSVEIRKTEARLFCNLIRSYMDFLIFEHNRLSRERCGS